MQIPHSLSIRSQLCRNVCQIRGDVPRRVGGFREDLPKLIEVGAKPVGKAVIGTVKGDVHDIGKNMLGMMLEGAGLEVTDLGYDVSPERFVEAIKDVSPQILGMSALLSTTMVELPVVIDALKEAGMRDQVKVIVGGAPVTQKYADDIGADGYGDDAATGADVARKFV